MPEGYQISRVSQPPVLSAAWDDPSWAGAQTVDVDWFHPRSGEHRPRVKAQVVYDPSNLYVRFHVEDRHVRAVAPGHQSSVCGDSCVEFFVRPAESGGGYFNFEVNCGGTMLVYYITDHRRKKGGFEAFEVIPVELVETVAIWTSLPRKVEPQIDEPVTWQAAWRVPVSFFQAYVPGIRSLGDATWSGNFYKCADLTTHPHWACWSPVGETLDFHQPAFFKPLTFAG